MNPDALLNYQRQKMKENPYFPVKPENLDKIETLVITKKGLEELALLKHECIMGRATKFQIVLFVELMRLWATTNKNLDKLKEWKKYLDRYFGEIISIHYFPDLEKEGYAMMNPKYDSKYMQSHDIWLRTVMKKYYELLASGV